jgi:predicted ArsR family transcriptional regulator
MQQEIHESGDCKTRQAIVHLLKTKGALTSTKMAEKLGVTAMAVRQHLYALQAKGLVAVEERRGPIGRPAKHWRLTPDAEQLFPDSCGELTVSLLGAMRERFGDEGLRQVLDFRYGRQQEMYVSRIPPKASLKQKLQQLARLRTEEGYMAEVKPAGKGNFLLIENHCPISAAASQCQGFCEAELRLFRKVLGPDVPIQREEHIVSGDRRCVYRVGHAS